MANAVQKITLASARDIPFNRLVLSQANVRQVKAGTSVEELAESIARRGLIQSLHVRPVLGEDGAETGMFEVPAGGRRYRALDLLVKAKRLNKTAPVPCIVSDAASDVLIDEVSLAENIERAPLHPLDQFRAFRTMRDKGMSEEEIAAAFFVDGRVVKQRLRLTQVSPVLLDIYAEDGMTLEQLMAFTVTGDHARQEQIWDTVRQSWQKEPWQIRRMLTEDTVRASDRRVRFVGIEAYQQAGGTVLRDLFEADDGGWLQDAGLLDRLVTEKLKGIADEVAQEGWKWIEVATDFPFGNTNGLRRLVGEEIDPTDVERAERNALQAEYDKLEAEYAEADELPDEVDARLGEIEAAFDAFENRPVRYDPNDIARSGAFASIDHGGTIRIDRGYVRSEDEAVEESVGDGDPGGEHGADTDTRDGSRNVVTMGGQADPVEDEDDDGIKPLPERLIVELTAHRTLALRDAVAEHPHIAMTALLHKLVSDTFLHRPATGALEAQVRQVYFPAQANDLKDSASASSVTDRHERWADHVPADDDALWDWLIALDEADRMDLLAHCVSYGINALYERPNPHSASGVSEHGLSIRMAQADRLAQATGMDMAAAGWKPTVANYLGRVTKARIVEAVREGAGERAAQLIEHMKKGDMAKEAERLLADSGWLPEPLRRVDLDGEQGSAEHSDADAAIAEPDDEADALPAFLTDEDDPAEDESDLEHAIAAE